MKNVEIQKIRLVSISRGIVLFTVITISLFHVYFDNSPNVTRNNHTYKQLLKSRDSVKTSLLNSLNIGILNPKEFVKAYNENEKFYKNEISKCNNEKREIIQEFSFNGRKSFHYWFFIFGLTISFFALSLRYSYRILSDYKSKNLSLYLKLESIAWIAVSFFWVTHSVFARKKDFPSITYLIIKFSICLIIAFSIFYLIKYVIHKKRFLLDSYRNSIIKLISLISDLRVNHYFFMAAKAQTTENKKIIEKDVEIVDEKIFSTLENVADES